MGIVSIPPSCHIRKGRSPPSETELLLADVVGETPVGVEEPLRHEPHRIWILIFVVRHRPAPIICVSMRGGDSITRQTTDV